MKSTLTYGLLKGIIWLFSLLPFAILYLLSDLVAWLLQYIIRYRKPVIDANIKRAFPDKSQSERKQIRSGFYKNLADVLLETIREFSLSEAAIKSRYVIKNQSLILDYFKANKSVVLTLAHISNWEWAGLALGLMAPDQILCVYHPIKNPVVNDLVRSMRSKFGMVLFPPKATRAIIKEMQSRPCAMVLVADQSPAAGTTAAWVDFFGIETGFVPGPEQISRRYDFPLIDMDIQRVKRGYYEVTFKLLHGSPAETKPLEVSQIYARHLEGQVKNSPANWLWSHKRWKKVKPPNARVWK